MGDIEKSTRVAVGKLFWSYSSYVSKFAIVFSRFLCDIFMEKGIASPRIPEQQPWNVENEWPVLTELEDLKTADERKKESLKTLHVPNKAGP